jgi:GNAT superfamily N-acetyltransferase
MEADLHIRRLTPLLEGRIERNPSLNMDTFIIPSPYVSESSSGSSLREARDGDPGLDLEKDYEHSYVWDEEGELLGYFLVYTNADRTKVHLYKQVTSPFGRGKGIGSAFLHRLSRELEPGATVYLYVWEKQTETLGFFLNKGFARVGRIVYRNLVYHHLAARAGELAPAKEERSTRVGTEDLGRTRHDARKTLRLLQDMVDNLSMDNCNRIIEDINRETTALVNLLNSYRDTVEYFHDVDLKELIFERIIPYVQMSHVPCEVRLSLAPQTGAAYTHYLDVGRALVNLVSNSLDAIEEAGRPGVIQLTLADRSGMVHLVVEDNGVGIEPSRLAAGPDGLPAFVGQSTKARRPVAAGPPGQTAAPPSASSPGSRSRAVRPEQGRDAVSRESGAEPRSASSGVSRESGADRTVGEGLGTRQVFAAFGAENIRVESERGRYTRWTVQIPRRTRRDESALRSLEERYRAFRELSEFPDLSVERNRPRVASFLWQTTSLETLCWDLIIPFGMYSNIREIYRGILVYLHSPGGPDGGFESLQIELAGYRVEPAEVREWLVDTARMLKRNLGDIARHVSYDEYAGHMFRSYGQSVGKTVIFTLDPLDGRFLAADRKLAEHVDFAPYLGRRREDLIRGELIGDVKNVSSPLRLGVWSITGEADALGRLAFLRTGCRRLVAMGIPPEKRLALYFTTYRSGPVELDTYRTTTLGELAGAADGELTRYLVPADEEVFFSGTAD